jgi:cytochrome c oxidase subunit IV
MIIKEKIKLLLLIIIPSLIIIIIGILEIKYPDMMKGLNDGYTGRGLAGFMMLIFELFLLLTWGKLAGIITIILTLIIMSICIITILQDSELKPTETNQVLTSQARKFITNKGQSFLKKIGR